MQTKPHLVRRVLAAGVDYTLFFGLVWLYLAYYGQPAEDGGYRLEGCGPMLLTVGAWIVLIPLLEGLLGYTLGKGLLGLQVVKRKGGKASPLRILFRRCFDIVDFSFGGLVGILLILYTRHHQRIGDLVADTRVVTDQEIQELRTVGDTFA